MLTINSEFLFLSNIQRAFRQYEQAMGAAANMQDRMAQMEAMDGAARCLETLRLAVSNILCTYGTYHDDDNFNLKLNFVSISIE